MEEEKIPCGAQRTSISFSANTKEVQNQHESEHLEQVDSFKPKNLKQCLCSRALCKEEDTYCHRCEEEVVLVEKSGWVFRKVPHSESMRKYWLRLVGRELYIQKNPNEVKYDRLHTLVDLELYFAKSFMFKSTTFHGIELINGSKSRVFYMPSSEERK